MTDELGTIQHASGRFEATLERTLDHSCRKVWEMLTTPNRLVEWLAPGSIELRLGGAAKLDFTDSGTVINSTVTALQPERLLQYSWSSPGEPHRPVRWELVALAPDSTKLTLRLSVPENEDIARACAGWEAHLMMLLAALEGVPIKFPFERFKSTRDAYRQRVAAR